MNLAHPRRLVVAAAAVAAGLTLGAVPAQAGALPAYAGGALAQQADPEEGGPGDTARVWAFTEDLTVAPAGAPAKDFHVEVITSNAVNPRLVIDTSGLAGVAVLDFPAGCTTAGAVATCPAPPGSVDNNAPLFIPVRAAAGARAGAHGTVTVTGDADNPGDGSDLMTQEAVITVAGHGPDLVKVSTDGIPDAALGDQVYAPFRVANLGDRAVQGIRVTVEYTRPLAPTPYANCRYGLRTSFPERGTVAVCDFTRRIDPGAVVALSRGFGALVTDAAADRQIIGWTVAPLAAGELPSGVPLAGRGGARLPLVPVTAAPRTAKLSTAADIAPADNNLDLYFDVANTSDLAAVGADATGAVGDTVPVEVGVRNLGGAIDFTRYGSSAAQFTVQLPSGAEVVTVPANCALETPQEEETLVAEEGEPARYLCQLPSLYLDRNASFLRTFELRLTGASYDTGVVSAVVNGPASNGEWSNDTAAVNLTVTS